MVLKASWVLRFRYSVLQASHLMRGFTERASVKQQLGLLHSYGFFEEKGGEKKIQKVFP